jgi:spectrin alpha
VKKIEPGLSASQQALAEQSSIAARQVQIDSQYQSLMALARERQRKLSETCKAYVLVREAAELAQWIKNKVECSNINSKSLHKNFVNGDCNLYEYTGTIRSHRRCWRGFGTSRSDAKKIRRF